MDTLEILCNGVQSKLCTMIQAVAAAHLIMSKTRCHVFKGPPYTV